MARSVSTHGNAVAVFYLTLPANDENEDTKECFCNEFAWQDFVEDLTGNVLPEIFPSLRQCDRWNGRENHVIAENSRCEVSVSEYNGIVAICLAPADADNPLDVGWCVSAGRNFNRKLGGFYKSNRLTSQGTFSNGEQCFTLAAEAGSCVTSKEGRLW